MLGDISGLDKIYIVCGHTDMRKSIDGLCSIFILLHLVNRRGRLVFGYKWRDRIFFYRCAGNIPIPELKSGCNAKIKAKMKAILRFSRFSM